MWTWYENVPNIWKFNKNFEAIFCICCDRIFIVFKQYKLWDTLRYRYSSYIATRKYILENIRWQSILALLKTPRIEHGKGNKAKKSQQLE